MGELSLRNEVIVNNKTFVDTLDSDWRRAQRSWHRELAASSLKEWLVTIVGVACSWRGSLAVGFDTGRECELVALQAVVARRKSGE